MNQNSGMQIEFENYLASDDKTILINGNTYYKIVYKYSHPNRNNRIYITIPTELLIGNKSINVIDEEGREFILGPSVHMCFRDGIPEWYVKTLTVSIEGIDRISDIGNYLSLLE